MCVIFSLTDGQMTPQLLNSMRVLHSQLTFYSPLVACCNTIGSLVYILKYKKLCTVTALHSIGAHSITSQTHVLVCHYNHGYVLFVLVLANYLIPKLLQTVPTRDGVYGKQSEEGVSLR